MATSATFRQIRAGLVANLANLGIQSTGYMLSEPMAPAIEIFPGQVTYDQAMARGLDLLVFTVRITVAVTLDVPAQETLDEYLAPSGVKSVKTLLESDRTLGGKVQTLQVPEASGHQITATASGGIALSASWTVEIRA